MKTEETNKALAVRFFELLSDGRVDEALAAFAEEGEWWVAGNNGPGYVLSNADMAAAFRRVLETTPQGLRYTTRTPIAEGDVVVVEVHGSGELANGNNYDNRFCFILTIRDGKIVGGREYTDTQHAVTAFAAAPG